jgi:hypothetical protein
MSSEPRWVNTSRSRRYSKMAKAPAKGKPAPAKNVVALKSQDQVPDYVRRQTTQGRGVATAAEDNLVPMIAVLSSTSRTRASTSRTPSPAPSWSGAWTRRSSTR